MLKALFYLLLLRLSSTFIRERYTPNLLIKEWDRPHLWLTTCSRHAKHHHLVLVGTPQGI